MIYVKYTDGSEESYDSIEEAEDGIHETVTGCDFAATVETVEDTETGETLFVSWSCKVGPLKIPSV